MRASGAPVTLLALLCVVYVEAILVDVPGGTILGARRTSAGGRPYYAFQAVPYAASPETDGRFKPPRPVEGWHEVLLANTSGPYCAQAGRGYLRGEEDCLHLSVYTPHNMDNGEKLPVLVWLHGGAFIVSGAADYDPRLLMDRDLVLVVPQYRLGFLGFIHAFNPAPGNYGMLDQAAALRWVRDNIATFGGDPSRVTLAGDCAGGASALYHMISPQSQGLFQRVVSVSGSPLDVWALHPPLRRTMVSYADALRCPRSSLEGMRTCFQTLAIEAILNTQGALLERHDILVGNGYLAPAIQSYDLKRDDAKFLSDEPLILLSEGKFSDVPVLMISSKNEGNYIIGMTLYEWMLELRREVGDDVNDGCITRIVKGLGFIPGEKEEKLIWSQYLAGLRNTTFEEKLPALADLLSDALYNTGLMHTARLLSKKVPVKMLRFDFEDGLHKFKLHPDLLEKDLLATGAGHLDPLLYFLPEQVEAFDSAAQRSVSTLMLDLIDDFTHGRETEAIDFPSITGEDVRCAVLDRDGLITQDDFLPPERAEAAHIFFQKHHVTPLYKLGTPPPRDEL